MIQSSTAHRCRHCRGKIVAVQETLNGPAEYHCLACARPYPDLGPAAAPAPAPGPAPRRFNAAGEIRGDHTAGIDHAEDRAIKECPI